MHEYARTVAAGVSPARAERRVGKLASLNGATGASDADRKAARGSGELVGTRGA